MPLDGLIYDPAIPLPVIMQPDDVVFDRRFVPLAWQFLR